VTQVFFMGVAPSIEPGFLSCEDGFRGNPLGRIDASP